ncbi:hypothetical protein [Psychrobacillus sp. NPDC096389]|uniref:hypothetical protein n=1 Tax=Psychrobacillus sp. NPDC096389 TaxID=3364490 RepID=UPI0037FFDFAA
MEELPYVMLILIATILSWIDYRKKFNKAKGEEEIRSALVPFLLMIIIFVISIITFLT